MTSRFSYSRIRLKKISKAIEKSTEPSLFDYSPTAIFSVNMQGTVTYANRAFENLSGYAIDELLGTCFINYCESDDRAKVKPVLKDLIEGVQQQADLAIVHKLGKKIFIRIVSIPDRKDHKLHGMYGVVTEIPEQKVMEHQWLVDNIPDVIGIVDFCGNILLVNDAIETIFGWSKAEIIQKQLKCHELSLFPDDSYKQQTEIHLEKVKKGELVKDFKTIRRKKDGTLFHVNITYSPLKDPAGQVYGYAVIVRDVTEKKKTEIALKEVEAKFRSIYDNTSDIISIVDVSGTILDISQSTEFNLGFPPEYYKEKSAYHVVHPDDVWNLYDKYQELMREKKAVQVEYRLRHAEGNWVIFETRGVPVLNESGAIERIVSVSRNITERKQAEELLRESEKLSVLGQLAAGIAHEIRNPLTSLKGFLQLLKHESMANNHYFDIMLSELDRINFIVSELLVLSKPQLQFYKQQNINTLLENVIALLESQANLNNVQFMTNLHPSLPAIVCEENKIKQVFINLVKNSIEAMPNGGHVTISTKLLDRHNMQVEIADNGPGIPIEAIPKLGEPFYTTKANGTGLGLMVTNKILRDHRGYLRITSEQNQGTTVHVVLPIARK